MEAKFSKIIENLDARLATIRAGRANPGMLNGIMVNFYGTPTPIQSVANITVPEAKQLFINSTYRNSQELIDLAGSFVMKNPFQIKKNLISSKKRVKPIKICFYGSDQYDKVARIIEKIYKENPQDKIMILARKNKHIEKMLENPFFEEGIGSRIIYKKHPSMIIDAMSVHSSKGLGADQVILLSTTNRDFPCKEVSDIWIKNIFKNDYSEDYPDAEDRRIFYVALTRTKKDIYIMTPNDVNKRSPFINEIYKN